MTSNDTPRLDDRDLPDPGHSAWSRVGRWAAWTLIAAWGLFLLLWAGLYGVLLPHVSAWKPQIEAQASRTLGIPVRVGDIEVTSTGWIPALRLTDLQLLDERGQAALRLPSLWASLSPRALLSLQPRFEQLLIEGASLEVRRDAQGRLHVAGLAVDDEATPAESTPFDATDWLLAQGEFAIRGAQIRWVDEQRKAPPLVLRDVDFVLRNSLRRHDMRLDATPQEGFGGRWTVRARFRQGLFDARSDWRTWSGEAYAELPQTDVAAWRPHLDLPAELLGGQGAARVWVDVERGRVRGATADVALQNVSLRWAGVGEDMAVASLQGRVMVRQEAQAVTLALQQLGFTTAQGLQWPSSDMKLVLRHERLPGASKAPIAATEPSASASVAASAAVADAASAAASGAQGEAQGPHALPLFELLQERRITGGDFNAARLDLNLLSSIALRAPLGAQWHEWLRSVAPQGRIEDMSASWEGPPDDPQRYRATGRLSGLVLQPGTASSPHARPGVEGASVVLEATESGGRAELGIEQGALTLPGMLEEARVPVEALAARLNWQWRRSSDPAELEVNLSSASVRNADLAAELRATWRTRWGATGPQPGQLDLNANLSRLRAEALWRYLPLRTDVEVRSYVRRAVRAGQLQDMTLRLRGDMTAIPFNAPGAKGEFLLTARARDATLAFLPGDATHPAWPEATRLETRLRLDGRRLEFTDMRARIFGVDVTRANARIELMAPGSPLSLDLQARGPAQDLLRFVHDTPIDGWTGRVLGAAQATGAAQLALKLDQPLYGTESGRVRGTVQLAGSDLKLMPGLPTLSGLRGRVEFSEKGFSVAGVQGQWLGGDVAIEGGLGPTAPLGLTVQGQATAQALRAAPELQWLQPVTERLSGQAPYRVVLAQPGGVLQWTLSSNLAGMGIQAPAPVGKTAAQAWTSQPLRLQVTEPGEAPGALQALELQGGALRARLWRAANEGGEIRRGVLAVGVDEWPAVPQKGMEWTIAVDRLDADEWWSSLGGTAALTSSAATASPLLPSRVNLRADHLLFRGRALDQVRAGIVPLADGGWSADVNATQLGGQVEWRPERPGRQARLMARLDRLSVPEAPAESADRSAAAVVAEGGDQWPAVDLVAQSFELRGRKLGRLAIEADVRESGRLWQLRQLSLRHDDAELQASGFWRPVTVPGSAVLTGTQLNFNLTLRDSGSLLSRLGYADTLRGGEGALRGGVAWSGSPVSPNIRTMQGRMRLELERGRFLKADPGAARLLGVLSLQTLPRRLVLDFRDVFEEGFAFDDFDGDVEIDAGVASTRNLRMRGVQAAVLMEGRADILRETQDLRVLVVPEINAGTASLAYAAVNPVLGLGTFLAQLFLRRPLMAASTREFQITGSWADPKVERVQRPVGGGAPTPPPSNPPRQP